MAQSIAQMAASSQSPPPAGFPRAGPQHLPGQVQLPPHLQAQLPHAQLPLPQPQLPFGFPGGPPGRAPPHAAASSYLGSLGEPILSHLVRIIMVAAPENECRKVKLKQKSFQSESCLGFLLCISLETDAFAFSAGRQLHTPF